MFEATKAAIKAVRELYRSVYGRFPEEKRDPSLTAHHLATVEALMLECEELRREMLAATDELEERIATLEARE